MHKNLVLREWKNEETWIEFWNDNEKAKTQRKNCDSCRLLIYTDLLNRKDEILFFYPYNCWKTYANLGNWKVSLNCVAELYSCFPSYSLHGKFKKSEENSDIYIYSSSRKEALEWKQRLLYALKRVREVEPSFEVRIRRGCEAYESVFGPWQFWKERMKVKNYENVEEFLKEMEKQLEL